MRGFITSVLERILNVGGHFLSKGSSSLVIAKVDHQYVADAAVFRNDSGAIFSFGSSELVRR